MIGCHMLKLVSCGETIMHLRFLLIRYGIFESLYTHRSSCLILRLIQTMDIVVKDGESLTWPISLSAGPSIFDSLTFMMVVTIPWFFDSSPRYCVYPMKWLKGQFNDYTYSVVKKYGFNCNFILQIFNHFIYFISWLDLPQLTLISTR